MTHEDLHDLIVRAEVQRLDCLRVAAVMPDDPEHAHVIGAARSAAVALDRLKTHLRELAEMGSDGSARNAGAASGLPGTSGRSETSDAGECEPEAGAGTPTPRAMTPTPLGSSRARHPLRVGDGHLSGTDDPAIEAEQRT